MSSGECAAGAWPVCGGVGPRESLPAGLVWPGRRGEPDGPSPWQARAGEWRPVGGGWWVPASIEQSTEQCIVQAGARLPAYGAVTGWAALRWAGGRWFSGTDGGSVRPIPLALGDLNSVRRHPQFAISREILPPGTICRTRGLRLTSPLWSVAYEMRKARTDTEAVVAFEMAAYEDFVSIAELSSYVDSALWVRQGVQRIRRLLPLLEENSWSPMEPIMRMVWRASGHGSPGVNRPVFNLNGTFVGTPDLFDPLAGVYGLYDGALHLAGAVRSQDVAKEAAYRDLGLEGATMMAGDLRDTGAFLDRLEQAYARAGRKPADDRRWLLREPDWWVPTWTVEMRRGLSAYDRSRVLRYRAAA